MIIGITDTLNKKFDAYVSWLRKVARDVEFIRLSPEEKNAREVKKCEGLILTGGHDVHPRFYGREDFLELLNKDDINEQRDEFEFKIIQEALKANLPILGICRGMQVFNVAMGGSMIPDLKSEGYSDHTKTKDGKDRRHKIQIEKGTTLHWIVETTKAEVNTAHHQAVDAIGGGLRVTATAPDGIVEGLEWAESASKPFLQLVQWHPERMADFQNPCSKNLLEHFILAVVSTAEG
jgi:putative glutamine amidotransferase